MDDTIRAFFEKYSWDKYTSKHLKYYEVSAFDLETSIASDSVVHITDQTLDDNECETLARALQLMVPENLKQLYLSGNKIGDRGVASLVKGALALPNFELLFLAKNADIGDEGMVAIAEGLAKTKIWQLVLTETKIGNAGAKAFAAAIDKDSEAFSSLRWLFLDSTQIGDKGVEALAKALTKGCKSLERLALQNTKLTNRGARARPPHHARPWSRSWSAALPAGLVLLHSGVRFRCARMRVSCVRPRVPTWLSSLTDLLSCSSVLVRLIGERAGLCHLAKAIGEGALPKCEYLYVQNNEFDREGKMMLKAATKPRNIKVHFGWPPPLPGVDYD